MANNGWKLIFSRDLNEAAAAFALSTIRFPRTHCAALTSQSMNIFFALYLQVGLAAS